MQPVEERTRGVGVAARVARSAAVADALRDVAHTAHHRRVVLDAEEHGFQHGEDLVLDPPQPLARVDPLDVELAQQLARSVLLRAADPDHPLPLAADGEDRMDCREDAQPLLLEIVLEALEDERRVGGVGFDDRDLGVAPVGFGLRLVRVADDDVNAGQALVELKAGGIVRATNRKFARMRSARASGDSFSARTSGMRS